MDAKAISEIELRIGIPFVMGGRVVMQVSVNGFLEYILPGSTEELGWFLDSTTPGLAAPRK